MFRKLLLAGAVAALVLAPAGAAHAAAPASAPNQSVAQTGPYCPDHPDVPQFAQYLGSHVAADGRYVDNYRVPFYFGYQYLSVVCD